MAERSLSVVIPVYNEPDWIDRTVQDLRTALDRSPFRDAEVVLVDDGSDEPVRAPEIGYPLRILRQQNSGRFAARRAGIEAATGDLVLLLDSRITLHPDALAWVAPRLAEGLRIWNGHCVIETDGNPYARFWDTLTTAAFAEYFAEPRTTSFGLEDFDRFPKGTTHFLAPRTALLEAMGAFRSRYEDVRHANDDTLLIRELAARDRINISPFFSSTYRSRTALGPFLRHAFHRGTVFFDGFARPGTRFFGVVIASFPGSLAGLALLARRPRLGLAAAVATPAAAAALARARWRRPWPDVAAFATLSAPFAVVYTAGIWRGALLALLARRRA